MKRKPVKKLRQSTIAKNRGLTFSYKRPTELYKYVTDFGTILPRVETGLSQKQQRRLAREIKRARHLALLPFTQTV